MARIGHTLQAAALAATLAACGAHRAAAQPAPIPVPVPVPVPVTVIKIARRDVPEFAAGIGTVQAYRSVLVRARVDGELQKIAFREGQEVKPNDALAEIDPRPYAAVLEQARARRQADQTQLDNAHRDLDRYTSLARTNFASRQQVDTQTALVSQYAATIAGDDATIASAALNLAYCHITAPIAGVVGLRLVDVGNQIHATDTTGIVSLTQIHPISVVFTLPQDTLPAIREAIRAAAPAAGTPGDALHAPLPVLATASADGHILARGTLTSLNNTIDATTGTIAVKAEFANTDDRLWPGLFVGAKLQLGVERNALVLPPDAVQHGPDGLYVYVITPDNRAEKHAVRLGYQDETVSVVTDGLADGMIVVLSGQLRLQPGALVVPHLQDAAKS